MKSVNIILDDSTRGLSGSPNIPIAVQTKIEAADIVVCDLTPICMAGDKGVANPNVLYELGYAVPFLTWDRVIIVCNLQYGTLKDGLPFDIDRQRAASYTLENVEGRAEYQLEGILTSAIKTIIEKNPPKNEFYKAISTESVKRRRDVTTLERVLSVIHFPTLDEHIRILPDMISTRIIHFWVLFDALKGSSQFHLYDERLRQHVMDLHESWRKTVANGNFYWCARTADYHKFGSDAPGPPSQDEENVYSDIIVARDELEERVKALLEYIRTEYIEVDIEAMSSKAWKEFIKEHDE